MSSRFSYKRLNRLVTALFKFNLLVLLVFNSYGLFSQTPTSNGLEFGYQYGYVFPTNTFVQGVNSEFEKINRFESFSFRYNIQTDGSEDWHHRFRFPKWGVGIYMADFFEKEQIGLPIAFYFFFNSPYKRWNKLSLDYNIDFGLAFNWKRFDPNLNFYNVAMGAGQSVYIDMGLKLNYSFTERLDGAIALSVSHFSNGALKKPNSGINVVAPKLSIAYSFKKNTKKISIAIAPFEKKNEWLISAFWGVTNVIFDSVDLAIEEKYRGVYFPIIGINALRNWQVSYKSKVGIGLTYAYNSSINAQVAIEDGVLDPADASFLEKNELSVSASYEYVVNKVSMIFQPSYYLYRKEFPTSTPRFYQMIGLRCFLTNRIFTGITLKAHDFSVSDFILFNAGIRL